MGELDLEDVLWSLRFGGCSLKKWAILASAIIELGICLGGLLFFEGGLLFAD